MILLYILVMENLIQKYLKKKGISQSEFARRIGVDKQLVQWHIKHPESLWNPKTAMKIERATSGEILAYDLIFK